jgi:hypothetical protein
MLQLDPIQLVLQTHVKFFAAPPQAPFPQGGHVPGATTVAQAVPVKPLGQLHNADEPASMHVPPFWQDGLHARVWQEVPVHGAMHEHKGYSAPVTHVPDRR